MHSIDLYYNFCIIDPLGYELYTKMNTNAIKTVLHLLVYLSSLSFVTTFQHIE
jgi:hypothetical protein